MSDLARKQLEVLAFIRRFMKSAGLPPTRGEIAEGLGLKNRQGIDQHLRALEGKGCHRTGAGHFAWHSFAQGERLATPTARNVELGRRARSMSPSLLRCSSRTPIFYFGCVGDSMKDADILDRDLLAAATSAHRMGRNSARLSPDGLEHGTPSHGATTTPAARCRNFQSPRA